MDAKVMTGADDGPAGPEPAPIPSLRALDRAVGTVEHGAVAVCLALLILVGTYQSIASHLLDINATWPFEIIRYSVFFIAMAGAALAAQRERMISMDFASRLLPARAKVAVQLVIAVFVVMTAYLLFEGGMSVRESSLELNEHYDFISPGNGLLALPIGAALIGFHFLLHAIIDVIYLVRGQTPPESDAQKVH